MTKFAKFAAVSAMVLSFASPVGAVTVAELQAQINALMAQLSAMSGGAAASTSFTTDLTIGSKGAEVTALQDMLIAGGHLSMPAGVAKGYFGALTKSAVAKWQTAKGITPAAGYFGAKSRAAAGSVAGTPATPAPAVTGITTPGVEGSITVSTGTVANSTMYAGDSMVPVLAFKVKAQTSDVAIQRVKLDFGQDSKIFTRVYSKAYLVDEAGAVVASADLNLNTLVKSDSDSRYYLTFNGFSSVVPKDVTKTFTLKADVRNYSSTDTTITTGTWIIRLAGTSADAVRGTDGAGIDQYAGASTDASKQMTASGSLVDSATLTLATGSATPTTQEVVAADGTAHDQANKQSILTFDVQAKNGDVKITALTATVSKIGTGTAIASSTYLYVGDTLIGSASLSANSAAFTSINYVVPKDTTKTFTLKADITSANATQVSFQGAVTTGNITAENANGDTLAAGSKTGSATGNLVYAANIGPVFTVGSITTGRTVLSTSNNSTTTATYTFPIHVVAKGGAIMLGTLGSSTPMASNLAGVSRSMIAYVGGTAVSGAQLITASTTDYTLTVNGSTATVTNNGVTVPQDSYADATITFNMQGNLTSGVGLTYGSYAMALERLNWINVTAGTLNASTFMAGQTSWRSASVTLP